MSKEGIGYFSFDTDFFHSDKKVKIIKGEFGSKGVVILIHTLCAIYSDKGYYMEWGEDDCYLASDDLGCDCSPNLIGEVINRCVKRGIFDEEVFHMFGVLTSHGIQIRFLKAASKREKIGIIKEYALFDLNELKEGMRNKVTFFSNQVARKNEKVASCKEKVASCSIKKESKERYIKNIVDTPTSATASCKKVPYENNSFELQCVDLLIQSCKELYPNAKVPSSDTEKEKWAIEIDRMKRLDNRSEQDIVKALHFAIGDSFWKANIRSTKKFREKFETLFIQSKQKGSKEGKQKPNQFTSFPQREYGAGGIAEIEKRLLQKRVEGN